METIQIFTGHWTSKNSLEVEKVKTWSSRKWKTTARKKVTVTGPLDQRRNIMGYPRFKSISSIQVVSEYFDFCENLGSRNCIIILTLFGETSCKNWKYILPGWSSCTRSQINRIWNNYNIFYNIDTNDIYPTWMLFSLEVKWGQFWKLEISGNPEQKYFSLKLMFMLDGRSNNGVRCSNFLAVQDSSIGDLVTHWVSEWHVLISGH